MRGRQFVIFILCYLLSTFPQFGISSSVTGANVLSLNRNKVAGSDITITVKNINTVVRSGALVKLYNSDYSLLVDTKISDSSGQLVFSGLSDGAYNFDVSYSPSNNSPVADNTEFWGTRQITIAGSSQSVIFTRNQPYISVGSTFSPSTLKSGNSTSGSFTVKNILSGSSDSYVSVWMDRDKANSWDLSVNLPEKTIVAGGTAAYPFTVYPTESGTYFYYALVYSNVNGNYVITDQYSWTQAFVVQNPEQAITNVKANGTVYGPGSTVHVDVTAINSGSAPVSCKAEIRIDRDKQAAYDFDSGYLNTTIIQANQQTVFGFDWQVPVDAVPGTYYIAARLQAENNSVFSVSDSTTWETSIDIENTSIAQIEWSGYVWNVKNISPMGPGNNNWLGNSSAVWVDATGNLHLKIRKSGTKWYCSEISTYLPQGYGEYTFQLKTDVETFDQNIVLGLFTYESDTREIDIEFSRWSDPSHPIGVYVVQPTATDSHNNFSLNLPDVYSTHKFRWNPSEIFFQSYSGNYPNLPDQSLLINQWTYTGSKIPPDGNERVILNLWLNKGVPPTDLKEAEVVIKSFSFKKVGNLIVQVQNHDNLSSPEPGANGIVQLYNSDDVLIESKPTDQNGEAVFSLKPEGSDYYCRVFYQPNGSGSIDGAEYWGTLTGLSIIGNETQNFNFKRDEPYQGLIKVYAGETEVNGQSLEPNTELRVEQQIINPASQTKNVKGHLLLNIDQTEPANQQITDPDFVSIPANSIITSSRTITPTEEGSYFYSAGIKTLLGGRLQITDSVAWSTEPLFTIKHVNIPPVANAGSDRTVNESTLVTLDGTASSDPENDLLSFSWTAPEGIELSSSSVPEPTFTAPEVSENTNYTFSLVVNDGKVNSSADQVVVTVKHINKAPSADAGANQTVDEGKVATLDATASTDPENDLLSYQWTAPEGITLSSAASAQPTFTAPEIKNDTTLNFTLMVNDGFLNSVPSTVQISIRNVIKTSSVKNIKDGFNIYPNPTKGTVTIVGLPANVRSTIEVFTIEGKLVMSRSCYSDTCTIDISRQSAGNYLVKVNQHSVQIEKK